MPAPNGPHRPIAMKVPFAALNVPNGTFMTCRGTTHSTVDDLIRFPHATTPPSTWTCPRRSAA
ncbi:hypothetical protein KALB_7794 [Kutzneria albida DSM 43870]|uniref:Uncharacterized protein n=1 Tax=Kutzneria albida DSM 43870 TaxID=1449976 RepID=W5WKT9_9PSEU|nr:hypothetical protein KALB_7794 [Kutzneria albida DSM 43870]